MSNYRQNNKKLTEKIKLWEGNRHKANPFYHGNMMGMMEYFFMYHFKKRGVLYEQEDLQCFGNCCHVDNFGGG